jgi:hypothetical protein
VRTALIHSQNAAGRFYSRLADRINHKKLFAPSAIDGSQNQQTTIRDVESSNLMAYNIWRI